MTILKQPAEVLHQPVRFAALEQPSAIVSATAAARGLLAGAAALVVAAALADGGALVTISGGSDGEHYLITVRAAGADGAVAETELEVAVIDTAWTMPDGGAPYLSIAEFAARFGLREVVAMTDGDGSGRIDRTLLVAKLIDAQAVADAHIAARYLVPLDPVPLIVKKIVGDLARAALHPDGTTEEAKLAMRMLERIQAGTMPIPAATPPAVPPAEATILIAPGQRVYPDGLAGY